MVPPHMALFKIPRKAKDEKLKKLSAAQRAHLDEIEANALADFQGQLDELESAIGMLRMGHHFGWKVIYLIHSKRTVRKYEEILGIKVRELFDEEGPSTYRSVGYQMVKTVSNFWKVVSGAVKIDPERKREVAR